MICRPNILYKSFINIYIIFIYYIYVIYIYIVPGERTMFLRDALHTDLMRMDCR